AGAGTRLSILKWRPTASRGRTLQLVTGRAIVFPAWSSWLAHLRDLGPQLVYDVDEMRLEANVEGARARQIDRLGHDDVPGPRAPDVGVFGQERRFSQIVRDQDHGEAELLPQVAQHAPQFLACEGIERGERLVEHQQRGLMDQCATERDALLHAARQLPGKTLAEAVEPDGLEERAGLAAIAFLLSSKSPPM